MHPIDIELMEAEQALDRSRENIARLLKSRKCVGTLTVDDSGIVFFTQNSFKLKTGQYLAFVECSEFDEAGILKRPTIKLEDH